MNKAQEITLAKLNGFWGVANWTAKYGRVYLELANGIKVAIDEDGEVVENSTHATKMGFVLPDKRLVYGHIRHTLKDHKFDVEWNDEYGVGQTPRSECIELGFLRHIECSDCDIRRPHVIDDYICVYCRYDLPVPKWRKNYR